MIEAYAFLAAFAVQVLVVSAVNTTRLVKYVRNWSANYGSERFAQVYPGVDLERWVGRFVTGYRAANAVIVLVGLVLLGWLFKVVQQPDWPAATTGWSTSSSTPSSFGISAAASSSRFADRAASPAAKPFCARMCARIFP